MGDITKNFSKSEFVCKCGCKCYFAAEKLIMALQSLRDKVGVPITINSGCRCPKHNRDEGGSTNSQHMVGRAADIEIKGYTPTEMFVAAEEVMDFRNGGIGLYPGQNFIHVDVRDSRARWGIAEMIEAKGA